MKELTLYGEGERQPCYNCFGHVREGIEIASRNENGPIQICSMCLRDGLTLIHRARSKEMRPESPTMV